MRKFYDKRPLGFALAWIGVYVVSLSLADALSVSLGMAKAVTLPVVLVLALVLILWMRREGLARSFGLCPPEGSARGYLYYLPLALLVSANLWFGAELRIPWLKCLLYILSMLLVGVVEELIFRGLLFKALCRDGLKLAIIISSVSFGLGHIVNLLNGAPLLETLLQLIYASAAGFMFTMIFHRSGSILVCAAAHGIFNALSAFAVAKTAGQQMLSTIALTAIALGYGIYLLKKKTPAL